MTTTASRISGADRPGRRARHRRRWWDISDAALPTLRNRRCRRVLLILVLVWMVAVFDLLFTLTALRLGDFHEANPLARQFIDCPLRLSTFKFGTLAGASLILLAFSHRRLTELGCWLLAGVYTALAVVWLVYFLQQAA